MYTEKVNVGDKLKLTTDHIVEITKVIDDVSGEYFEGHDLANGVLNSFFRESIVGKVDD